MGRPHLPRLEIKRLSAARHPLYVLDQAHPRDGRDLLRVGFDATLEDDKTQQHTPRVSKNTFLGVEFDAVCSEFHEGLL